MSQFYTRKGDDGYTGLLGDERVSKSDPRPEAIGSIDEANAAIGWARAHCRSSRSREILLSIQRDLYNLMAEISATPENAERFRTIDTHKVNWLEEQTDILSESVDIPKEFITPGDSLGGAALDLARTVVRRAERRVAQLWHTQEIKNPEVLKYLNRLSSLCFVLELFEIQIAGTDKPTLAKGQPQS